MTALQNNELKKYTPCNFSELDKIIEALATVHTEIVLIHPFRDGNGRIARLISQLMALQAGLPLLDFDGIQGQKKQAYFVAVQAGMSNNYHPMIKIFRSIIKRTLRTSS